MHTQSGNRSKLIAATVFVLFGLSVNGQAPPPSDVVDTASGITNVINNKAVRIWASGNKVNIDLCTLEQNGARMDIYELTGQLVFDEKITTDGIYTKQLNTVGAGYVIVKITNANGCITRKLFISSN